VLDLIVRDKYKLERSLSASFSKIYPCSAKISLQNQLVQNNFYMEKIINSLNSQAIPDFEGYSPIEMNHILYHLFEEKSPIQLKKMNEADYVKIPIFNQIKYLAETISKIGELKLTAKGYLPTKTVADLYAQGFLKDDDIESGFQKLYKETDSMQINLTRILLELAGIAKKRNGKLSLTKHGEKTVTDDSKLLNTVFRVFATKFNWAYYDGYGNNHIGQLGLGFSLILLNKYGHTKRLDCFYAEKYFIAFPALKRNPMPAFFSTNEKRFETCYSIRTFERFLSYFGFIHMEKENASWNADSYISKTDLFDKYITCTPPNLQHRQ
jgi:hypothetical protein